MNDFQTAHPENLDKKKRLLREIVEAIMWELDAMRQGRWEEIHNLTQKKRTLLDRMETFDWDRELEENKDAELHMLQSNIMDLEYQLKKNIDAHMSVVQAQLDDVKMRSSRLRATLQHYKTR